MLADIKYHFKRTTALRTSYILQEKKGDNLEGFPAVYTRIPRNQQGAYPELLHKQYCNFRKTENKNNCLQVFRYPYCISLASARYPIGFDLPDGVHRAASNNRCMPNRNDCFLIEFSQDWNDMTIYVFFRLGWEAEKLLRKWNNGESITVRGAE